MSLLIADEVESPTLHSITYRTMELRVNSGPRLVFVPTFTRDKNGAILVQSGWQAQITGGMVINAAG